MLQNLKKVLKSKISKFFFITEARSAVCARHVVKRPSKRSVLVYSIMIACLKEKNIQINKFVGMGFDGAATFSGKNTGVQARMKNNSPHALIVHCCPPAPHRKHPGLAWGIKVTC